MKIGIISYLPNDDRRSARIVAHHQQLEWLKSTYPNFPIIVVAQNYRDEDFSSLVDEYIRVDEPIGPAQARNLLLERFYDSKDDFTCILDDDTILKDVSDGPNLIKYIDENPSICQMDAFTGISPRNCGFRYTIFKEIERHENHFTFSVGVCGIPFLVIRNLKKYYNKPIYFRDYFDKNTLSNTVHEDVIFVHELMFNNMRVGVCADLIHCFLDRDITTISHGDCKKDHNIISFNTKKELMSVFGIEYDLDTVAKSLLSNDKAIHNRRMHNGMRRWKKQHNIIKNYRDLDIPRPKKYTFEKELVGWRTKYTDLRDEMMKRYGLEGVDDLN